MSAKLDTFALASGRATGGEQRQASLTLAANAADAAELLEWLDMLGLPPRERPLRSYNPKQHRSRG